MPETLPFHGFFIQCFAVFVMLAILSVLIIVHECGHFLVARLFGFQTPVFGFGLPFGPHVVVGHKWNTEFRIHALLLGGFVAIPELGDETNKEAFGLPLQPFRKFPLWQRALVALAGIAFNVLFAYLIMVVMFFALGEPTQPTIVHSLIKENPIAAQAGILPGDELVCVNQIKVTSPTDAVKDLVNHKDETVVVSILRDKKPLDISMRTNPQGKVGMALVSGPVFYQKVTGNFFTVAVSAANKLWALTISMLDALGQMVGGLFSGGKATAGHPALGLSDLHGVLAVVKIGADIAQQDWSQLFLFTIMISMDLAIINLFPWPALDGGHLAFMAYEGVFGKPMNEKAHNEMIRWGFISLLVLMMVIMVNDVTALCSGKLDFKLNPKEKGIKNSADGNAPDQITPKTKLTSPGTP